MASTIRTAQHGTVRCCKVWFALYQRKICFSGDVTTLKRKPDAEVKIKPEPSEPVQKKTKDSGYSASTVSEELPVLPEEVKKEKKKKKAKSYFDDL